MKGSRGSRSPIMGSQTFVYASKRGSPSSNGKWRRRRVRTRAVHYVRERPATALYLSGRISSARDSASGPYLSPSLCIAYTEEPVTIDPGVRSVPTSVGAVIYSSGAAQRPWLDDPACEQKPRKCAPSGEKNERRKTWSENKSGRSELAAAFVVPWYRGPIALRPSGMASTACCSFIGSLPFLLLLRPSLYIALARPNRRAVCYTFACLYTLGF